MDCDTSSVLQNQVCTHEEHRDLKFPIGYSICKSCGFAFYKDITVIKATNHSNIVIKEIPKFTNDQTIE